MTENHGGPWVPITGETTPGGTRMMGPGQRPEGIGAGAKKRKKKAPRSWPGEVLAGMGVRTTRPGKVYWP